MKSRKPSRPLSPLKTIRRYCLRCCSGQAREIGLCPAGQTVVSNATGEACPPCPLYPYRYGRKPSPRSLESWDGGEPQRPLRAIRARCLDCAPEDAWQGNCGVEDCPLYPYRLGKNPNLQGKGRGRPFLPKKRATTAGSEPNVSEEYPAKGGAISGQSSEQSEVEAELVGGAAESR